MRTIIVYGNCQARLVANILSHEPTIAVAFRVLWVADHKRRRSSQLFPTTEEFASCAILIEQQNWSVGLCRNLVPSSCAVVTFPPIDSMLLWPFCIANRHNDIELARHRSAPFLYADRVVLQCLDEGMSIDETVDYYRNGWESYAPNLKRIAEMDRLRRMSREEVSDVRVSDIVDTGLLRVPLFDTLNHPRREVLGVLTERIAAACAKSEPLFARARIKRSMRDNPSCGRYDDGAQVPIRPRVAGELGIAWFNAEDRYTQSAGSSLTHDEYIRAQATHFFGVLKVQRNEKLVPAELETLAWHSKIRGPIAAFGGAVGIFSDGFVTEAAIFDVEARERVRTLVVRGFVPAYHEAHVNIAVSAGAQCGESSSYEPGVSFELECALSLEAGERARVLLNCSQTFNLFDRGESTDKRDLSVVLTAIEGCT